MHPAYHYQGIGRALTVAARVLVREKGLWRSTGGSRLPGFHRFADVMSAEEYIAAVKRGEVVDPGLTAHLHDGWGVVTAIHGYLPNDMGIAG